MTVYSQIIRHLDRARFTPYVVLNSDAQGDTRLANAGGAVVLRWKFGDSLRGGAWRALRSGVALPWSLLALARFARREGIDVIQCSAAPRAGTLGLILARLSRARLLLHYHVLPGRYGGPRGFLESQMARRADRAVAVSSFLAGQVPPMGVPADRVDVVANGVDCERFHPGVDGSALRREYGVRDNEVLVLQLARIIQQKRQEDVVRAFGLARRQVPGLRCLIVGWEDPRYSGAFASYRSELDYIAREAGLGDSLIIAEARADAPSLLAAADIVAMPSVGDAWNLAVTEAMASGKPVIGSESGGIPEQIVDGTTGYLVPVGSPEALAERMIELARDPELRRRMGEAARRRAKQRFDERNVAAGFAAIYEAMFTEEGPDREPYSIGSRA